MDQFPISPDDCLILKAFKSTKSLREAAILLGCDPAGLARRAQQISAEHGFLQKVNNRWQVSSRGVDLIAWAEASIQSQKKILSAKSSLRLATTMWFAEELVIPNILDLKDTLGKDLSFTLSVPSQDFEEALIDGSVDFVIVCHPPNNPEVEHKQITDERWAVIAPISWKKEFDLKGAQAFAKLKSLPFIRHSAMNPDLFFSDAEELKDASLSLDNLIGIRSAVCEGIGWSVVPRILVHRYLKDQKLMEIPYDLPVRDRKVCLWWLRNRHETKRQSVKVAAWINKMASTV